MIVPANEKRVAESRSLSDQGRALIIDVGGAGDDFARDVRAGLSAVRKTLNPKYFYDDLGAVLFDAICRLPEYYVTRAEDEILAERSGEMIERMGHPVRIVELGSGNAQKTRRLLRAARSRQAALQYVAVDVDAATLTRWATVLTRCISILCSSRS